MTNEIPKIIHKIWFNFSGKPQGEHPKEDHQKYEKECQQLNNDYTIMYWNENDANEFIKNYYSFFYPYFMSYPLKIQKVDSLRYFILYHYGGIYLDMDIKCHKKLPTFHKLSLVEDNNLLNPLNLNNFIMVSPKNHSFWKMVFSYLIKNHKKKWWHNNFSYVLYSTGPGMLEQAYKEFSKQFPNEIQILNRYEFNPYDACGRDFDKNDQKVISHLQDVSWSNNVDGFIRKIYCNWYIVLLTILICVLIIVLIVKCLKKK